MDKNLDFLKLFKKNSQTKINGQWVLSGVQNHVVLRKSVHKTWIH